MPGKYFTKKHTGIVPFTAYIVFHLKRESIDTSRIIPNNIEDISGTSSLIVHYILDKDNNNITGSVLVR